MSTRKPASGSSGPREAAPPSPGDLTPQSPYLGLAAFEERHAPYFHGRKTPIAEVVRLVERHPISLLFGSSGLGKTSLLGAGVCPELRSLDFFPVQVRLQYSSTERSLVETLIEQVKGEASRCGVEVEEVPVARTDGETSDEETQRAVRRTLWGFIHQSRFWSATNELLTPVLILDQFEEMFTVGRGDSRSDALVDELAETVEYYRPEALRSLVQGGRLEIPRAPVKPRFRCLIAMREDFLPDLDALRERLPGLATRRYRLLRLAGEDAISAIRDPSPGLVTREVAEKILEFLARQNRRRDAALPAIPRRIEGIEVEPALLSLFCQGLNERRLLAGAAMIDEQIVLNTGELIVRDFYLKSVRDTDRRTRRFIEKELISNSGFRTTVALSTAVERGASEKSLQALVDRRLLRLEERFGEPHVELIHDVLTAEIRELHGEAHRARQILRAAVILSALVVTLASGLLYFFLVQRPAAQRAAEIQRDLDRLHEDILQGGHDCAAMYERLEPRLVEATKSVQQAAEEERIRCNANAARKLMEEAGKLDAAGRPDHALIRNVEAAVRDKVEQLKETSYPLPDKHLELTFRAHADAPRRVLFGGARAIYSLASDGIRVWDGGGAPRDEKLSVGSQDLVPWNFFVRKVKDGDLVVALFDRPKGNDLSGGSTSTIAVWNMGSRSRVAATFDTESFFDDLVVLPDGKRVIVALFGLELRDLSSPKAPVEGSAEKDTAAINRVVLDPGGEYVLGLGHTKRPWASFAAMWKNADFRAPAVILEQTEARDKNDFPHVVAGAFLSTSPPVEVVLALESGEVLRVRVNPGAVTREAIASFDEGVVALAACSRSGQEAQLYVATGKRDPARSALVRVTPAPGASAAKERMLQLRGRSVTSLALSADCTHLASAWSDGTVRVSSTGEGEPFERSPGALLGQLRRRLGFPNVENGRTVFPEPP